MHEKDIGNPHFCIHLDTKTRIDFNLYHQSANGIRFHLTVKFSGLTLTFV